MGPAQKNTILLIRQYPCNAYLRQTAGFSTAVNFAGIPFIETVIRNLPFTKIWWVLLDSTAVSIFVVILVELTNTVFVNSTNITTKIETAALSKFCKSSLLYPTIGSKGELKSSQNHFQKVLTLVEYSSLLPTFHLRGIVTHSRTDDYPIGRVLRDQAQFPSNRFFVEAKTEPKFIFLAPQVL